MGKVLRRLRLSHCYDDLSRAIALKADLESEPFEVQLDDGWFTLAEPAPNEPTVIVWSRDIARRLTDDPGFGPSVAVRTRATVLYDPERTSADAAGRLGIVRVAHDRHELRQHLRTLTGVEVRASAPEATHSALATADDMLAVNPTLKNTGALWRTGHAPVGTPALTGEDDIMQLLDAVDVASPVVTNWMSTREWAIEQARLNSLPRKDQPLEQFMSDVVESHRLRDEHAKGCERQSLRAFFFALLQTARIADPRLVEPIEKLYVRCAVFASSTAWRPALIRITGTSLAMAETPLCRSHYRVLLGLRPGEDDSKERERLALLSAFGSVSEDAFKALTRHFDRRLRGRKKPGAPPPRVLPAWRQVARRAERPAEPEAEPARAIDRACWFTAAAVCNLLSKQDGLTPVYHAKIVDGRPAIVGHRAEGYRLPTLLEWRTAAEPPIKPLKLFSARVPGWGGRARRGVAQVVGMTRPSQHGIFDMGGHVKEWCDPNAHVFIESSEPLDVPGVAYAEFEPGDDSVHRVAPQSHSIAAGIRIVKSI